MAHILLISFPDSPINTKRQATQHLSMKVLLVFSLDKPVWDGQMATRFLVSAEAANLATTVVLNKADLVSEELRQAVVAQVPCVLAITAMIQIVIYYLEAWYAALHLQIGVERRQP